MNGTFPPDIIAAAQAADRKWNVPASVSLAQWALESSWGSRTMGAANNCFGLKPWRASQRIVLVDTHEEIDGKLVPVKAKFCAFASIAECFDAHGEFLVRNTRYAPAFLASDGIGFAKAVAKAHYATDSDYADKLTALITRYGLLHYDVMPRVSISHAPAPAPDRTKLQKSGPAIVGTAAASCGAGATAAAQSGAPGLAFLLGAMAIALAVLIVLHLRKKA